MPSPCLRSPGPRVLYPLRALPLFARLLLRALLVRDRGRAWDRVRVIRIRSRARAGARARGSGWGWGWG